jgi:hypothetical protein
MTRAAIPARLGHGDVIGTRRAATANAVPESTPGTSRQIRQMPGPANDCSQALWPGRTTGPRQPVPEVVTRSRESRQRRGRILPSRPRCRHDPSAGVRSARAQGAYPRPHARSKRHGIRSAPPPGTLAPRLGTEATPPCGQASPQRAHPTRPVQPERHVIKPTSLAGKRSGEPDRGRCPARTILGIPDLRKIDRCLTWPGPVRATRWRTRIGLSNGIQRR